MRVVIAPDKFKGSLEAAEVAAEVAAGLGAEVEEEPVKTLVGYGPTPSSSPRRAGWRSSSTT